MTGLCECGCGQATTIAKQTAVKCGRVKGQPVRFIVGHNARREPTVQRFAYKQRYIRQADRSNHKALMQEHVMVATAALGKPLPRGADVHHVDENTLNNENRNLVICQDRAYHKLLHCRAETVRAGGDPNTEKLCGTCRAVKVFAAFNTSRANKSYGLNRVCRECQRAAFAKWYRATAKGRAA